MISENSEENMIPEKRLPFYQFWWIKFIGALSMVFAVIVGVDLLWQMLFSNTQLATASWLGALKLLFTIGAVHIAYISFIRWIEQRPCWELSHHELLPELFLGISIGFGLISSFVLVLLILGAYKIVEVQALAMAFSLDHLEHSLYAGYIEELLFRGIFFRMTLEKLGLWWSLIFQAALFGIMHGANPNATWFSLLAIAIEAGLLLGLFYVYHQRLWLPIGVHAGWNFSEGAIYGSPVSGFPVQGVIQPVFEGPEWLTGGSFGLEASVVTLIICVLVSAALFMWMKKKGVLNKQMNYRANNPAGMI